MSALQAVKKQLKVQDKKTNLLELNNIPIDRIDPDIAKLLQGFKQVTILVISECKLTSLQGLPKWPLTAIELTDNQLDDSVISFLANIPTLTQILLAKNNIASLDQVRKLSVLKQLAEVQLEENPVAENQGYRRQLFASLPALKTLDRKNVDGQQVADDEEEEQEFDGDDDEEEFDDDDDEQDFDDDDEEYQQEEEQQEKPKKKKK